MSTSTTITSSIHGPVAKIRLNRPDVHHAINPEMIRELTESFTQLNNNKSIRIIHLYSEGAHFCAGADLNWMKEGLNQNEEELVQEGKELAALFAHMRKISPIILTSVQGKVMGGANGLVAASDLVLAEDGAHFAFSEVKLGLVPATIAPFVVGRMGKSKAAAWMISGRLFSARDAQNSGLIDFICEKGQLEAEADGLIRDLLAGGPGAQSGIKEMIRDFDFGQKTETVIRESAEILARYRTAPEGQEGMKAFLEKRRPSWDGNKKL